MLIGFFMLPLRAAGAAIDLTQDNEFSVLTGIYSTPTQIMGNESDRAAKPGPFAGLRYLRNLDSMLALGFQLDAAQPRANDSLRLIANGVTRTKLLVGELLIISRVRFLEKRIRPYLLLGLGVHSTTLQIDSKPLTGFAWSDTGTSESRTLVKSRKLGGVVALESGVDYHISDSLTAGAYAGYHYATKATYKATAAGTASGLTGVKGAFGGVIAGISITGRY